MNKAVFLDRDGVLNAMVYNADFGLVDSPANPGEFRLLPGAAEAVRRINAAGFLAVVISNQPGIARGKFSPALLQAITEQMMNGLQAGGGHLDAVYYCPHHPQGEVEAYTQACDCRKPQPGLLLRAAAELDIDLAASYFIGDGLTDIQAGKAAGVTSILIYASSLLYLSPELARLKVQPDQIVKNLLEAVDWVLCAEQANRSAAQGKPLEGRRVVESGAVGDLPGLAEPV
jgi:D-glycero-D-manno-heptose 1,7-bisphosphate phosphatase